MVKEKKPGREREGDQGGGGEGRTGEEWEERGTPPPLPEETFDSFSIRSAVVSTWHTQTILTAREP